VIGTPGGDRAIPRYFRALGGKLAERGHGVVLLTEPRAVERPDSGLEIEHWPSKRPVRLRDARFFSRLVKRYQPDCVISNFAASNIMMTVAWLHRVPCRIDWYHTLSGQIGLDLNGALRRMNGSLQRARKRVVYRFATHVVANTHCAETDLRRVYGVTAEKTHVLNYAIPDPLGAEEPGGQRAPFRVVCPGRLDFSKGQAEAIRALALLDGRVPDIQMEFLGEGPCREVYTRLARELGVADRCLFRGAVPLDEVHRTMRSAAVTLVPSLTEAFGLVNIESMAVGTPVIASRTGGVSEVVRDGEDGLLVPPGDPRAIAKALVTLLSDPALREQMGIRARRHFLAGFDIRAALENQSCWLEQAVASRTTGAIAARGWLQGWKESN
jgi:glycosyltransferase involved in cell wall biosynthesis